MDVYIATENIDQLTDANVVELIPAYNLQHLRFKILDAEGTENFLHFRDTKTLSIGCVFYNVSTSVLTHERSFRQVLHPKKCSKISKSTPNTFLDEAQKNFTSGAVHTSVGQMRRSFLFLILKVKM